MLLGIGVVCWLLGLDICKSSKHFCAQKELVLVTLISKVARLVVIPTPAVTQGSFSSQAFGRRLEEYKYIVKINNPCVPLSRLLLTYQVLRGV